MGPDGGIPPSPCEHYELLASSVGCDPAANSCSTPEIDWEPFDACADEFNEWLDCTEQDLTQCYCEADGTANCEGSFKPSEGSALCTAEYTTFDECMAAQ